MRLFPIFLKFKDRKCIVVGAGKIASAKAAGLLRSEAQVIVISPQATMWIKQQARAGKLTWEAREFRDIDVFGAALVVAGTNSTAINQAVFHACQENHVLCNVIDDPDHCDFFYPSVVRRGALQIAISTGGKSPSLARRLREELQKQFGAEYGDWLERLGKMRKRILRRRLSSEERQILIRQISSPQAFQEFIASRMRGW